MLIKMINTIAKSHERNNSCVSTDITVMANTASDLKLSL
jgi:hypothetical protein